MKERLTHPWFDAKFCGRVSADGSYYPQNTIEGAQAIQLWCPCGFGKPEFPQDGARPHACLIVFSNPRNAPQTPENFGPFSKATKTHPRWTMSGTGFDDLTLTPSVDIKGNAGETTCWHGFITNGEVT